MEKTIEPFITLTNPFGASLTISRSDLLKVAQSEADKPSVSKGGGKVKGPDKGALIKLLTGPATSIANLQDELREVVEAVEDPQLKETLTSHIASIGKAGTDLLQAAIGALGPDAPATVPGITTAAPVGVAPAAKAAAPASAPIASDLSAGNLRH